ncbi:putative tail protein [Leptospira phage LE4]|uniref:Putative tail protein n=1 Tax=Leptospira phage LE4 TaxID=2041383 RepID=A0A343LED4_9CAUD|nr:putative tail protein [Leptospira phage LE4]ATN95044.1 putative tail protein [Leptospira phage LE4]
MRRRGVFGYNLPPQVGDNVRPADFSIVGMIGLFARRFDELIQINQPGEISTKLGGYITSGKGRYVLENMFTNAKGQPMTVWVKTFVASNAVNATRTIQDQNGTPDDAFKIQAGYQGKLDKSSDGNKTGFTLTNGARFETKALASASSGQKVLRLVSVADIRIGDVLFVNSTSDQYCKVDSIDASTNSVTMVDNLTQAVTADDVVQAIGFQIKTYRKNQNGVEAVVNTPLNNVWLSLEVENEEFYIENAFRNHPYFVLEDLNSASTLEDKYPADVTTVTYLTGGSDGTAPSTASDWDLYSTFDSKNIRWLFNPESTLETVNKAGESYCSTRLDAPVWIYTTPSGQSKDELKTIGASYQRSDQVQGVICSSSRNVVDPIGVGANPTKSIPVSGAIIGAWIRAFYTLGFHRAPAGDDVPLLGFVSTPDATEDTFTEDERTEIQERGVNIVQQLSGRGLLVRSFRTPSTNVGALFGHYLVMQNFIKVSSVESLYKVENRPNKITRLKTYGQAIEDFGRKLYKGSFPFGIDPDGAFQTYIKEDGSLSGFEDVFTVQVDEFNNPQEQIDVGEGNAFVRFYPASLLESFGIGVGTRFPV